MKPSSTLEMIVSIFSLIVEIPVTKLRADFMLGLLPGLSMTPTAAPLQLASWEAVRSVGFFQL